MLWIYKNSLVLRYAQYVTSIQNEFNLLIFIIQIFSETIVCGEVGAVNS